MQRKLCLSQTLKSVWTAWLCELNGLFMVLSTSTGDFQEQSPHLHCFHCHSAQCGSAAIKGGPASGEVISAVSGGAGRKEGQELGEQEGACKGRRAVGSGVEPC